MTQTFVPTGGYPRRTPLPSSTDPGGVVAASPPEVPSVSASLLAVGGLAVFGACAALGAEAAEAVVRAAATPVAAIVGAMILTGPALVASHLLMRPSVAAEAPVAALGQGLTAAGSVAAGIAPLALFLVATTGLWPVVLALGFALTGVACAVVTVQTLSSFTGERPGFVYAWALLAALVSIRIAIAVGLSALEVAR